MSNKLNRLHSKSETHGLLPRAAILTALLASACSLPTGGGGGGKKGVVERVIDGDTFDVRLKKTNKLMRVRLWGVDCAESTNNSKCKRQGCNTAVGKRISRQVRGYLEGEEVTVEPPYRRNGNRQLAYIRLINGVDLGRHLVKSCLCEAGYKHKRKRDYTNVAKGCR